MVDESNLALENVDDLGIWDIEHVKVPNDYDPRKIMPLLQWFFSRLGVRVSTNSIQAAIANMYAKRIEGHQVHYLCHDGLVLTNLDVNINEAFKDAANRELLRLMKRWLEARIGKESTLVLLSGDGGFFELLEEFSAKGIRIIVIHPFRSDTSNSLLYSPLFERYDWFNDILPMGEKFTFPPAPFFGNWGPSSFGDYGAWRGDGIGGGPVCIHGLQGGPADDDGGGAHGGYGGGV